MGYKQITLRKRGLILLIVGLGVSGSIFLFVQKPRTNVVFITIDSLRADHLGCYGYKRKTSPNIDALSRRGALFSQAISQASWTTPSVSSIITSLYPEHATRLLGRGLSAGDTNIVRLLKKKGYTTALFSNAGEILEETFANVRDDFDVFDNRKSQEKGIMDAVGQWLERNQPKPLFLWVYLFDVHFPYRTPMMYSSEFLSDGLYPRQDVPIAENDGHKNEYYSFGRIPRIVAENGITNTSYYVSRYDGGIKFADEQVSRLLEILRDAGMDKNTLIVFFSDHGESMGEHQFYFNHSHFLYEGLIRVPLIMVFPGKIPPSIVREPTAMLGVMPTVLEILGIQNKEPMEGKSFLPALRGKSGSPGQDIFSESTFPPQFPQSVRSGKWKLICAQSRRLEVNPEKCKLYDLETDLGEEKDLRHEHPTIAEALKERLWRWRKTAKTCTFSLGAENTEEKDEEFRAMGYLQ